jgi:endonuclease/exonuclease/phosphatase family metal-dependent hydrolase
MYIFMSNCFRTFLTTCLVSASLYAAFAPNYLSAQTAPFTTATFRTISEARKQPFGTVLYVAGRVTVANEFGGPSYIQDATGGLAVFESTFSRGVSLGDSVEVTGPSVDFQATTGVLGSGLAELSGTSVSRVTWRIIPAARIIPVAREVSLRELTGETGEALEGQLIRASGIRFSDTTLFKGGTNYTVTDFSTSAQVRVSAGINLINQPIPRTVTSVVGVLGQFRGTYQITPRTAADLGISLTVNPADTVAKSQTLDVTTWNLKWFGRPFDTDGVTRLGPADSLLQFRNVVRVLDSIDADVYALEEVSNNALFMRIVDSLPRYGAVIAGFAPPQPQFVPQRTAYLFKRSIIDTVRTEMVLTSSQFAAGRFPLRLEFDATLNGVKRRFHAFVIHAKSGSTQRDYDLRTSDAKLLYDFLNTSYPTQNVILAGDFNDSPTASIFQSLPTPYLPFVQDSVRYTTITASLARQGLSSFSTGGMIDNVVVSNELTRSALTGGEKIESPFTYIAGYTTTTTDHFPVTTRFLLDRITSVQAPLKSAQTLNVVPNPATEFATLRFTPEASAEAVLTVSDVLGKTLWSSVMTVRGGEEFAQSILLENFARGLYVCRVQAGNGSVQSTVFLVR